MKVGERRPLTSDVTACHRRKVGYSGDAGRRMARLVELKAADKFVSRSIQDQPRRRACRGEVAPLPLPDAGASMAAYGPSAWAMT